jgi:hypothetical protein
LDLQREITGLRLSHSVELSELSPGTRYYYQAVSSYGVNADTSAIGTFTTIVTKPGEFHILRLPTGDSVKIDGAVQEWPAQYLLATVNGDENVYYRTDSNAIVPDSEWNAELYGAYDDDFVYFAVKVIADDYILFQGQAAWREDNIKVNPGGQAAAFYVWINGVTTNPSCPYKVDSTLFASMRPDGNGQLPVYEFALSRNVLDPFGALSFQISVGTEDNDSNGTGLDQTYIGFGAYYDGDKLDTGASQWDNPLSYPMCYLETQEGPPLLP